jgi:hypothetical protein
VGRPRTADGRCFTAVVGIEADEAIRRFGGDLGTERAATFEEAFNPYPDAQYLVFDRLGEGVLIGENNGWEGSRVEVAQLVSPGGRLASVYWSVNADMSFLYAVDGGVVAWFDPLLIEQGWVGSDPDAVTDVGRDLSFGVEGAHTDSFVLLERLTGVVVEPSWLEEAHRCVDVEPLPAPEEIWGSGT